MTDNEARERADRIWGTRYLVTPWDLAAKPGRPQYAVRYPRWRADMHFLDPNGHAICHQSCAEMEDEVGARESA